MNFLSLLVPSIRVYSIDEAFLRLDGFKHIWIVKFAGYVYKKIVQWIRIGPAKVLTKK